VLGQLEEDFVQIQKAYTYRMRHIAFHLSYYFRLYKSIIYLPFTNLTIPMRILVVDDEAQIQPLFEQRFRHEISRKELSFTFAQSGEEALASLTDSSIILILSDINMPGMSGLELLRRVRALAALTHQRPSVELIHLFVAAPAPVCFVIGQELHLRNNVPFQTYRFRQPEGQRKAILLTAEGANSASIVLTSDEQDRARHIRENIFTKVLVQIQQYAINKQDAARGKTRKWYEHLDYHTNLSKAHPFPQLPPIWEVVIQKDTIDPLPYPGNEYTNLRNQWKLSDSLLIGLDKACKDEEELEQLIRLFFFHEYVHGHHSLNKFTVRDIGRFENCLEELDYMADLYALIHQLDYVKMNAVNTVKNREHVFLAEQLDLILRSTWAFIPGKVVPRLQVRSVRRLLNWYWRHIQVERTESLNIALQTLAKAPAIELVGPKIAISPGRIFMLLDEIESQVELALAVVLENAVFYRREDAVNTNLKKLIEAFYNRDHEAIKLFFEAIYEGASQLGGALPK
jgi:CheY-like chemotaxis protein